MNTRRSLLALATALSLLATRPALAASKDPERAAPSAASLAVRPLVQYLVATLHLSVEQASAVQAALQASPQLVRSPELLARRLSTVLSETEFERLRELQADASTYGSLNALAMR